MQYGKELRAAIGLAKEAGKEVMKIYNTDFSVGNKKDDSPLTLADTRSNDIIMDGLKQFGYGIISEESDVVESDSRKCWVIDPLDGTEDFVQKTDEFAIMISLLVDGKLVLGVVYGPAIDKLYYATKGDGAFVERAGSRKQLQVSDIDNLSDFTAFRSRNHFLKKDKEVMQALEIARLKTAGSSGIKLGLIGEGKGEFVFYSHWFSVWDVAAGHIILKEAGGDVFDQTGNEPEYDLDEMKLTNPGLIATNGTNKEKILDVVRSF